MTPHDHLVVEADRTLARLVRFCEVGRDHGVDPSARLVEGMFGVADQIGIAARFPLRGAYPLARLPIPAERVHDGTWGSLGRAVEAYRRDLRAITAEMIDTAAVQNITCIAGDAVLTLDPDALIHRFIVPNMLFHAAMAYAILRAAGAPLGKGDFDGLHVYRPGFRFV